MSPSGLRVAAALVALAILAISLIGGCAAEPSAEPTVRSFLLAWEQGRYWDAASYTKGPGAPSPPRCAPSISS